MPGLCCGLSSGKMFLEGAGLSAECLLSQGLGTALLGLILAALLCHFLYYLVPAMLGMKTGLPLYIVGTSTYGATGGFLMPGFVMGLLQFGWLGVNACFSAAFLVKPFYPDIGLLEVISTPPHIIVAILWAAAAAFMGLKGIQYVARVATYLPLIPLAILVILFLCTIGGVGSFEPAQVGATAGAEGTLTGLGVILVLLTYVIGFFATAGAAGTDFGMNSRDAKDVSMGGLVGISGATIFAGGLALLIVAGAFGSGKATDASVLNPTQLMGGLVGTKTGGVFMWLLALAAFPPACFSSFIAANSFKTTLPKVNPFITVGIGTAVSILLAVTGWAADVMSVFGVIGASFGPVCGAMMVDYVLSGKKWAGPRAGWNIAGWVSWVVGFIVGMMPLVNMPLIGKVNVPAAPLVAFIVGAVLYFALAKAGMESKVLGMAAAPAEAAPEPAPAEAKAEPAPAPAEEAKGEEKEEKSE
ncbi:MAG: cytosine permease [Planctomycetota bacterium]|jgi:cytosine permease